MSTIHKNTVLQLKYHGVYMTHNNFGFLRMTHRDSYLFIPFYFWGFKWKVSKTKNLLRSSTKCYWTYGGNRWV